MQDVLTKTLDCLLISPSIFYNDKENIWKEINSNFPPLGLASIASFVRANNFSVNLIDCNIYAPSVESFEAYFRESCVAAYDSVRLIGITSFTFNIKKALNIAAICKKHYPKVTIIVGGCHATAMPEDVLKDRSVDIICIGEGELTFLELLQERPLSDIKGIVYKDLNGLIITTPPRPRIKDIDQLPMPAYDLLPILKYQPAKGSYKRLPAMSMVTSRGCPGRCTFCFKTLGDQLVFKSAEKIFEEIIFLVKNYGIKQILFYDDTFTVYKKNVVRLCDLIVENNIDISWTCFARVDFVDKDMLLKMKQAGCHQIMYGIENIDQTVLDNINKKINTEQVMRAVTWTKAAGIECRLAFMVGNPGDTEEIIRKNIEFINTLDPDLVIINIATPLPGTAMFKWAKEHDLILTYNWDDYTLATPVMRLENLTVQQIKDLYKLMYRSFYFRPSYMLRQLFSIRSWNDVARLCSGLKALLSFFR
ncbi:MAG: radical SAM protein [Candidatus Omnitrophica bacterium]|nr:radical SAM protein [Candidatus Omnitrophota bacterium]